MELRSLVAKSGCLSLLLQSPSVVVGCQLWAYRLAVLRLGCHSCSPWPYNFSCLVLVAAALGLIADHAGFHVGWQLYMSPPLSWLTYVVSMSMSGTGGDGAQHGGFQPNLRQRQLQGAGHAAADPLPTGTRWCPRACEACWCPPCVPYLCALFYVVVVRLVLD